jgi:hypothetical protein
MIEQVVCIDGAQYTVQSSEEVRWFKNRRRNRFEVSGRPLEIFKEGVKQEYLLVKFIPSRHTEALICVNHPSKYKIDGKVIRAGNLYLMLIDVFPCEYCPNLDRWDERIKEWAQAHPEEYKKSVLNYSSCRPSEWALQISEGWRSSFGWNINEMRKFLDGELDSPPKTAFERIVEKEQQEKGEEAARKIVSTMASFIAGAYDD